jgi:hypothetical protein
MGAIFSSFMADIKNSAKIPFVKREETSSSAAIWSIAVALDDFDDVYKQNNHTKPKSENPVKFLNFCSSSVKKMNYKRYSKHSKPVIQHTQRKFPRRKRSIIKISAQRCCL